MRTYKALREQISLIEVVRDAAGVELRNGVNQCPVCRRQGKFNVYGDTSYKCFHPACEANEPGDVWQLLQLLGVSTNFKESLSITKKYTGINIKWSERSDALSKVLDVYIDEYCRSDIAKSYLISRGINDENLLVGYAPPEGIGHIVGKATLSKLGLLNKNNTEFYSNRIIFPFYDVSNRLVHLQGRSLNSEDTLRWLSTKSMPGVSSINNYVYNLDKVNTKSLTICEGISDCLSLETIGINCVATTSLETNIAKALGETQILNLVAIFDSDVYPEGYGRLSNGFKSWYSILGKLVELKELKPHVDIWCMQVPAGCKDINDWLLSGNLTQESFNKYAANNAVPGTVFAYNTLKDNIDMHPLLWRWLFFDDDCKSLMVEYINKNYPNWIDYIYTMFKNGYILSSLSRG
jgi:hypothetical protein